jgi:hypothetical protein
MILEHVIIFDTFYMSILHIKIARVDIACRRRGKQYYNISSKGNSGIKTV